MSDPGWGTCDGCGGEIQDGEKPCQPVDKKD